MTEPTRLTVLAHPATAGASRLGFGDDGPLLRPPPPWPRPDGVVWRCGPERACLEALAGLGGKVEAPDPRLAGPDPGAWRGLGLDAVAATDPSGLQAWLGDVDAAPPGGESLAALVARVAPTLAEVPSGRSVWLVAPLVGRALAVAALGAPASLLLALELGFGERLRLVRGGPAGWRLQALGRVADGG